MPCRIDLRFQRRHVDGLLRQAAVIGPATDRWEKGYLIALVEYCVTIGVGTVDRYGGSGIEIEQPRMIPHAVLPEGSGVGAVLDNHCLAAAAQLLAIVGKIAHPYVHGISSWGRLAPQVYRLRRGRRRRQLPQAWPGEDSSARLTATRSLDPSDHFQSR